MNSKKYIKISLSAILTVLLSYGVIFAWVNLDTVNGGENLTAALWNSLISKVNENGQKLDGITNIGGKIGIGESNPVAKLEIAGPIIRTIAHSTGNGPNDDKDIGQIMSRVLNFNKLKSNTDIRISYTDNLRTLGTSNACRREIKVDGVSCINQPLIYDLYTAGVNMLRPHTMVGYCSGISSGSHQIQVWVGNTPGYTGSDCYTGWNLATWVIEVEEVN